MIWPHNSQCLKAPAVCFCVDYMQIVSEEVEALSNLGSPPSVFWPFCAPYAHTHTCARTQSHTHIDTHPHTRAVQLCRTTCAFVTQQDVAGWMFEVRSFAQTVTNNICFWELITYHLCA